MPSEANITTRSTGLPACLASAVPEAIVRTIAAAPMSAGASQRARRFMCAPLPGLPGKPTTLLVQKPAGACRPSRLRPHEPHALVHLLERGRRGRARLLGTTSQHRAELRFVRAALLVARLGRGQALDDRTGQRLLCI